MTISAHVVGHLTTLFVFCLIRFEGLTLHRQQPFHLVTASSVSARLPRDLIAQREQQHHANTVQTPQELSTVYSQPPTVKQQEDQQSNADQMQQSHLQLPVQQINAAARKSWTQFQLEAAASQQNISRLMIERFHFLFNQDELNQFEEQDSLFRGQQQLLDRLSLGSGSQSDNTSSSHYPASEQQQQSNLETRTLSLIQSNLSKLTAISLNELNQQQQKRNFIRVLNRVFSRVELPDSFSSSINRAGLSRTSAAGLVSANGAGSASLGQHCANHIGCIAEIPNFPMILKLKPNVSASFTIYTRERGGLKNGQKITFEPLMHYQLHDGNEQTMSELALQKEVLNITRQLKLPGSSNPFSLNHHHHRRHRQPLVPPIGATNVMAQHGKQQASRLLSTVATSWVSANKIAQSKELPFDLAALEQSGFNASLNTRIIIGGYFAKEDEEWIDELIRQWLLLENNNVIKVSWQDSNRGLYHSAAYNSRIVGRQLSLFLHYLNELYSIDLNKFHLVGHSLGAHIAGFVGADNDGQIARITGLDPAGPIFVELSQSHRLDATDAKFVDVLHTNGGTITKGALGLSTPSGHVDYYCNGGSLQPGCFFSSVTMSIMDPVERIACNHRRSYRYFTEIIKLAISEHRKLHNRRQTMRSVGSLESSTETLESSTSQMQSSGSNSELGASKKFPHAFLFETSKQEDLVKLVQPELKLHLSARESQMQQDGAAGPPLRKQIEFHQMEPDFPRDKRGLYFFKTRQESPFFASKQYALKLSLEQPLKRKVTLLVKINSTLVAELELEELEQTHSLVFVPNNPNLIDYSNLFSGRSSKAPDLWLMWRQRSFNLLLAHHHQASELHLSGLELSLLDENESLTSCSGVDLQAQMFADQPQPRTNSSSTSKATRHLNDYFIRYELNSVNQLQQHQQQQPQLEQQTPAGSGASQRNDPNGGNPARVSAAQQQQQQPQAAPSGKSFVIARNQWHKFDGKPVAFE